MKVIDHIKNANGRTLFSLEILPPLKGENIRTLFDNMDPLMEFKPPFIDVTYHREEYVYKKKENGLLEKRSTRKRPGTVGICAAIQNHYKVDTVPHIICGGFNKEETENALIDLQFLGIDNVLALQGDAIKSEAKFMPEPDGHRYASELVEQIVNMNNGKFIDEDLQHATPTNFCIGVSGYPEKHFSSPNLKTDLKFLKNKVDLGAEYIVTQMFFDNKAYFEFVDKCREAGITVPIIPGIKPITAKVQANVLPTIFHIDLPEELADEIEKCKDNAAVKQLGIEWCVNQSKELMKFGVPLVHFYSMGKSDPIYKIARRLF
ncbi:MAG: methylenetetrahydrofolate reductase [NAD(P)H] [Cytophagales bacterium]|nr:methylenetetrahydrofolate reductase [NAD(P)H] [Cytophagales bacterium]MCA6366523.1 methylenetetrahydrofolate reductase [NAD(P)H] [Cytophagales bacterium]MCA6372912.1 methylenetetrahydrofolate reductase [NAD(P)H] [Cytophagales bacterium]MCA6374153.1 methylenetetrahydrofolate reductase [NAD(P)H] [Cytophagales bacterium]MCA6381880.1 methylenetetrahydrofolate reductase [NAD(P)H] [Cytophagales bacterium]